MPLFKWAKTLEGISPRFGIVTAGAVVDLEPELWAQAQAGGLGGDPDGLPQAEDGQAPEAPKKRRKAQE